MEVSPYCLTYLTSGNKLTKAVGGEHAIGRNLQFPHHSKKYCVTLKTKATYELNVFLTKARKGCIYFLVHRGRLPS